MRCVEAKAKIDIPLKTRTVKAGTTITLTSGVKEKYALWHPDGIYDLPERFVGEVIRVVCDN